MDIFCKSFIAKCCCLGLLTASSLAYAAPFPNIPGVELDGDSVDTLAPPPDPSGGDMLDDWNTFYNGGANDGLGSAFESSGILEDTEMRVFRKGSKDVRDIDEWHFEQGASPPKNNIEHAACSAYNVSGDLVTYCMANREVTNGTATTAFWFFGNSIQADNATGDFIGTHALGDVYVAVDHDNGGKIGEIAVFEWDGSDLVEVGRSENVLETAGTYCFDVDNNGDDDVCATTNAGNPSLPWDNPEIQEPGAFIEVGINLSEVSPSLTCVSSAMATDRASTSIQAQTKNFLLFPFNVCGIEVTKRCISPQLLDANTLRFTIEGKVTNIGFGAVTNLSLSDDPAIPVGETFGSYACDGAGLPTGAKLDDFPLASLAADSSICYRAVFDSAVQEPDDTVTASASAGGSTVMATAEASCPEFEFNDSIAVTKVCETSLSIGASNIQIGVDYDGLVTNTGDVPLTNVSVWESHADPLNETVDDVINNGTLVLSGVNLAPLGSNPYSGSYTPDENSIFIPDNAEDPTDPACATFKDVVVARGTLPAVLGGGFVYTTMPKLATCKLCPNGVCPVVASE